MLLRLMDKVGTGAGIAGLHGKYMFHLYEKLLMCFPKWPQHNACLSATMAIVLHPCHHLVLSGFLNFSHSK